MFIPPFIKFLNRREFLKLAFASPFAFILAACGVQAPIEEPPTTSALPVPDATELPTIQPSATPVSPTEAPSTNTPTPSPPSTQTLAPTPACGDDDDEPTMAQTEGPYYTPNTPERTSLIEAGMTGTKLTLTGYVLTTTCQPIAQALIDFWHCDDAGIYDNVGYNLRGHQFTDDQGRYTLETIRPGLYPGRTRHIHVKVQAPNQPVLTTQLYFPNEPGNASDGIFHPALVMEEQDTAEGKAATFNFVLSI
jgi:protocatechuate 3,4-dioxygenase beta subunit